MQTITTHIQLKLAAGSPATQSPPCTRMMVRVAGESSPLTYCLRLWDNNYEHLDTYNNMNYNNMNITIC